MPASKLMNEGNWPATRLTENKKEEAQDEKDVTTDSGSTSGGCAHIQVCCAACTASIVAQLFDAHSRGYADNRVPRVVRGEVH